MNGGRSSRSSGYTIVETLIFLAVSGAMFLSAMLLISGRQAKAEFTSAVRDLESVLQDVANDVDHGYFSNLTKNNGNVVSCKANPADLQFNSADNTEQGANVSCIFAGKAVQFAPAGALDTLNTMTLAGRRATSTDKDVSDYAEATLTAIAPDGSGSVPDTTVTKQIPSGATIVCALYFMNPSFTPTASTPCAPNANATSFDILSFITTFKGASLANNSGGGGLQVDLVVPKGAGAQGVGRTQEAAVTTVNGYKNSTDNYNINPPGGIYVCLESAGTKQFALLSFGGTSSKSIVRTSINNGSCR